MGMNIWQIIIFLVGIILWMGTCHLFRNSNKELRRLPYFGFFFPMVFVYIVGIYLGPIIGILIIFVLTPIGAYLALARARNAGFTFQFVLWGWIPIWNIGVTLLLLFTPQVGEPKDNIDTNNDRGTAPKNNNVNSALKLGDMPQKFKDFD